MHARRHHEHPALETSMRAVLYVQQLQHHRETWLLADYADAVRNRFAGISRATAYRWARAALDALGIADLEGEQRRVRLRGRKAVDLPAGSVPFATGGLWRDAGRVG